MESKTSTIAAYLAERLAARAHSPSISYAAFGDAYEKIMMVQIILACHPCAAMCGEQGPKVVRAGAPAERVPGQPTGGKTCY